MAFDHEEHTQRLLESNARIEALRRPIEVSAPSLATTSVDTSETLRELISSPAVQKLCALFPTVDQRQLARVYKWPNYEYDASEIYKLKATTAFDAVDDTFESRMTASGKVEYSRKKGSEKDYKTPAIWSAAFLQWMAIRHMYTRDFDLFLRLFRFHDGIMALSRVYSWGGVLDLALVLHRRFYNDLEALWDIPAIDRDSRCHIAPLQPTARTPLSLRQPAAPPSETVCFA